MKFHRFHDTFQKFTIKENVVVKLFTTTLFIFYFYLCFII